MVNLVQCRLTAADVQPTGHVIHTGNLYLNTVTGLEHM